jgi:type II secretory pathway component GspD/PulD (secretin)
MRSHARFGRCASRARAGLLGLIALLPAAAVPPVAAQAPVAAQTSEAVPPVAAQTTDAMPASTTQTALAQTAAVTAPVTLSVQNLDIREVLGMLSTSRGLNVVYGADVRGAVSIDLREVPFDEALTATAAIAGCDVTRHGDIYFVRRMTGDDPGAALLRGMRTFRLNYADPAALQPVIEQLLSPIGKITPYPPLRTLVVEDRPEVLARVDEIVAALDIAPRQVLIEARIMEARLSKDMRFGIDWSLLFSHGFGPDKGSGALNVEGFAGKAGSGNQGVFLSWGEGDFAAAIENLEGVEELTTLAAPRLVATDGTEAEIVIGGQLGFYVVTTVENTVMQSVQFLDTGAQLRLTPKITGDGFVRMKIHPELSDGVIDKGLPSKTTAEVTTDVLVADGQTLFIGGLIRERDEAIRKGIPLLSRLPLIGALFGRTTHSTQRSELITLIKLRIIEPGESLTAGDVRAFDASSGDSLAAPR